MSSIAMRQVKSGMLLSVGLPRLQVARFGSNPASSPAIVRFVTSCSTNLVVVSFDM